MNNFDILYWLKRLIGIFSMYFFVTFAANSFVIIFHSIILQWFFRNMESSLPYISFLSWLLVVFFIKQYFLSISKYDRKNDKINLIPTVVILIIVSLLMIFVVLDMDKTSILVESQNLFMELPYIWLPLITEHVLLSAFILFFIMDGYFLFVYYREGVKYD